MLIFYLNSNKRKTNKFVALISYSTKVDNEKKSAQQKFNY